MTTISNESKDEFQKIILDIVAVLIQKKPDEPIPSIIQMLEEKKNIGAKPLSKDERVELEALREDYKLLLQKKKTMADKDEGSDSEKAKKRKAGNSSSESDNDGDEYLDELKDEFNP